MPFKEIHIIGLESHPQVEHIRDILWRHIEARCNARITCAPDDKAVDGLQLILQISPEREEESFHIVSTPDAIRITAGSFRSILYGLGKFLRSCHFTPEGIIPGRQMDISNDESRPQKTFRGMYFATHFHNYYHDAPLPEIRHYIEDLALWGTNTIEVWFDMHHYTGIDDPAAQEMIERLHAILQCAKDLGLRTCLGCLGNEAFADSPAELRADYNTGRANYGVELCPNKPGALDLMVQWFREVLLSFADIAPDFIALCPYDQGGCACERCKPWGANGFLKVAQAKAKLARALFPQTQIILHTWLFDYQKNQGEWEGLAEAFAKGNDWCDYIQADSHETFPAFPLEHGVPGNLPLLNFPEISMWRMHPWGGFGANPLPHRFQRLWEPVKSLISGGLPYSEGIYEDINKVLLLQWYWKPDRTYQDILQEYIAYEYSPEVVDDVLSVIDTLEANHNHVWVMNWNRRLQTRSGIGYHSDPHQALALMKNADGKLSEKIKSSWRWRILYLRAEIDAHLHVTQGFWGDEVCENAFEELTRIFHAEKAEYKCAPPTKNSIANPRSSEHSVTA
jgi:hypothetical protein